MDTSQVPVPEKVATAHSETVSSLHMGDRAGAAKLFGQHVRRALMQPVAWGQQDSLQDPCSGLNGPQILILRESKRWCKILPVTQGS